MHSAVLCLVLCVLPHTVDAHARMLEPPGRSSAWRFGFGTPQNPNDHELNCGGAGNQWASQGGKCGLCGDAYQRARPRDNEDGGKYGKGVIVKTYKQGQWIDIGIDVTANHKGWFEVRVCSLDHESESEACFDRHLLEVDSGGTRWMLPGGTNKVFTYKVKLPNDLACNRCVVQWKWHCGNNWGVDPATGKGCTGCAPEQEEFWSCSDVTITPSGDPTVTPEPTTTTPAPTTSTAMPTTTTPKPVTTEPAPTTTTPKPVTETPKPVTETPKPVTMEPKPQTSTAMPVYTSRLVTSTPYPTTRFVSRTMPPVTPQPTQAPVQVGGKGCRAAGLYARLPNKSSYDYFCSINCPRGFCPPSHCRCD